MSSPHNDQVPTVCSMLKIPAESRAQSTLWGGAVRFTGNFTRGHSGAIRFIGIVMGSLRCHSLPVRSTY